MSGLVRKALQSHLRLSSDLWFRNGSLQLSPAAALRMVDHHFQVSGMKPLLLPTQSSEGSVTPSFPSKSHDWFCVSQAVSCEPLSQEGNHWMEDGAPVETNVWIDRVGGSSVHLSNVVRATTSTTSSCPPTSDPVLATATRVFVRTLGGKAAPFDDQERAWLQEECSADTNTLDWMRGNNVSMPALEPIETVDFNEAAPNPALKVQVGPQHVNMANHVDHAFLLDTAMHAFSVAEGRAGSIPASLSANYLSTATLGEELQCIVQGDYVYVIRSEGDLGSYNPTVLLTAKATNHA